LWGHCQNEGKEVTCLGSKSSTVAAKKISVSESPASIYRRLRGWESRIRAQKVRGCLTCLYLPLAYLSFFAVAGAISLVSEQPDSAVAIFLVERGFPDVEIDEENFFGYLGPPLLGGFLAIPMVAILFGLLFPYIDPKRLGVAKAALVFFGSESSPCQFYFDFLQPTSAGFLVERSGRTRRYQQTWLRISGAASPGLDVECRVILELTESSGSGSDSVSDSDSTSSGTGISQVLERVEVVLKQDDLILPADLNVPGLTLVKVEAVGNVHTVEYEAESHLLEKLTNPSLNHTVLTQEKMAKIVETIMEMKSSTRTRAATR
jgi:hypothetical protein